MLVPESWLRSFCNPPISGQALADRLTMAGSEAEAYEPYGPQFSGVVVGEVLSVEKHPNAEKLTVCAVSTGNEMVRVVCGARSEEHTSELQSRFGISYAVFCL